MVQANHTSMQKNSLSRQSPYLVRIDPIHAVMEPVSDHNNALYHTFLQPWIKMMSAPQVARAMIKLNPLGSGILCHPTGI